MDMAKEYIIYCDESQQKDEFCSNFYGGLLIRSNDLSEVVTALNNRKKELNFNGEVKWQKITQQYEQKYIDLISTVFSFIREGKIKVRIMFRQSCKVATKLSREQKEHGYFILYYQFIKHGFGLIYSNDSDQPIKIRLYLDTLPDNREKTHQFKQFITALNENSQFKNARITISEEQFTEVDSHGHVLLQCLDIILGAMQFRLNNKHKLIEPGKKRRGSRTRAKEKVYKHILQKIQEIYPRFNIGMTTGIHDNKKNYWTHSYRHWNFVPSNHKHDSAKTKRQK